MEEDNSKNMSKDKIFSIELELVLLLLDCSKDFQKIKTLKVI